MSGWLKALVASTCIIVVGAVGFWSWKLLNDEELAKQQAEARALSRACHQMVSDLKRGEGNHVLLEVLTCTRRGVLSLEYLEAEGLEYVAGQVRDHEAKYAPPT